MTGNLPPQRQKLSIACATDERYVMSLGVALSSLLLHASPVDVTFYVMSRNLSDDARNRLRRATRSKRNHASIEFISVDAEIFDGIPDFAHLSADALIRLLMPELLPASLERVLYLDCDLLVFDDIVKLWNKQIEPFSTLAAIDPSIRTVSSEWGGLPNFAELGLPPDSPYYNTGLLLIDLKRWRAEAIGSRAIQYVRTHGDIIRYADQDAINALLFDSIGLLEPAWNVNVKAIQNLASWSDSPFKTEIAAQQGTLIASPKICHFAGRAKPWIPGYRGPFLNAWVRHLWKSRWFSRAEFLRWYGRWSQRHLTTLLKRRLFRE